MRPFASLALFLLAVVGGGVLIGTATPPGEWFAALQKPAFNPPSWLFAPVWTVLYFLIAIAGWRSYRDPSARGRWRLWLAQMALNFAWSPVFFALHRVGLALAILLALLALTAAFVARAWKRDRLSAWLLLPYLLWLAYAAALNLAILLMN